MDYLITFLEGLISFISPCMLPMLPLYISYLLGGNKEETSKKDSVIRATAFVLGFTVVFCTLGLFAGTVGALLSSHQTAVNIVCGVIIILLGLSYLGILPMNFLKGMKKKQKVTGVLSAFLFGTVYSVSLTPCVGAFLGSALMLASSEGGALKGTLLLLVYSLGLGVPFVISAVLIEQLSSVFRFIKQHYRTINTICGIFLIAVGIAVAFGVLNRLVAAIS